MVHAEPIDPFVAIAEPKRREILGALAGLPSERGGPRGSHEAERDVTWLVDHLGWPQPTVSKHLGVLRDAGLVSVERRGRRRLYSVNAARLRVIHEWAGAYERLWNSQISSIKERAERVAREKQH